MPTGFERACAAGVVAVWIYSLGGFIVMAVIRRRRKSAPLEALEAADA